MSLSSSLDQVEESGGAKVLPGGDMDPPAPGVIVPQLDPGLVSPLSILNIFFVIMGFKLQIMNSICKK